jgi:hypothetical protein
VLNDVIDLRNKKILRRNKLEIPDYKKEEEINSYRLERYDLDQDIDSRSRSRSRDRSRAR